MYPENPAGPENANAGLSLNSRKPLISALVCAGLCIVFMQTGFFGLFFLVPLGFCAVAFGSAAAWYSLVLAVIGNAIISVGVSLNGENGLAGAGFNILYFTVLTLSFTWIMAGNPAFRPSAKPAIPQIRTVFRFVIAAVAFFAMMAIISRNESFAALLRIQAEVLSSAIAAALEADAARRAMAESLFAPDRIIETFMAVFLRGGMLVSAFFIYFFSRQAAFLVARLFRRQENIPSGDLAGFSVPKKTILVLSLCLPAILIFRLLSVAIIEIAAWNVLVICAMMFLAQGVGIVLFSLARRSLPFFMKLLASLIFAVLLFSPGINMLVIGLLILLGIAELWFPLRKELKTGSRQQS